MVQFLLIIFFFLDFFRSSRFFLCHSVQQYWKTDHLKYETTIGLCLGKKTSYGEHIHSCNSLHMVDLSFSNRQNWHSYCMSNLNTQVMYTLVRDLHCMNRTQSNYICTKHEDTCRDYMTERCKLKLKQSKYFIKQVTL